MITFYYVRHGTTLGNLESRLVGNTESPLAPEGIQNAKDARDALRNTVLTKAYYSPMSRAKDTAMIVLEGHEQVPAFAADELVEWHFGKYEGVVHPTHQEDVDARIKGNGFADQGGESREEFRERIRRGFERIVRETADGERVLIASHGFYYVEMLEALCGRKVRDAYMSDKKTICPVPNGGISVFVYDHGVFRIERFAEDPREWKP